MPSEASAKEGGKSLRMLVKNTVGSPRAASQDALARRRRAIVWYVYLLQSATVESERYVGVTSDLKRRIAEHNTGKSSHTSKFLPWRIVTYMAFSNQAKAASFERYLKSGSGHAFANKRLW